MNEGDKQPYGVVIPAFGHPKFLAEAIVSACEQETDRPVYVVVVDDGCRFEETGETVSHLLPLYQGNLFYLRQKNTRLPGARNAGIRFLLNLVPDLDAIYLLDADNRLSPNSLDGYRRALGKDPKIGWAYPDISFFGLTRGEDGFDTRETAPTYSPLKHLVGNISEAGSMVRADVFKAGVMFDETMTSGFEDWEFWLSALDAGYHGVRAADTGFLYRGRPESMLADSRRLADGLVEKIRTKHKALFDPKNIMRLEHHEAPVMAVYIPEDELFLLMSDPLASPKVQTPSEFTEQFKAWAYNATEHFFPTKIMVVPKSVWEHLKSQQHYMRWWFWSLRETSVDQAFIKLLNVGRVGFNKVPTDAADGMADVMIADTAVLWRLANGDSSAVIDGDHYFHLSLPTSPEGIGPEGSETVTNLRAVFAELTEGLSEHPAYAKHTSRTFAGPHSRTVREILIRDICAIEGREPFPACVNTERTLIAFRAELLSSKAAVDKLRHLLEILKAGDGEITVVLESAGDVENIHLIGGEFDWQSLTDTIVPFSLPDNELEYSVYLGKRYQRELTVLAPDDIAIVARTSDRIIACGPSAIVEALGEARLHGASGQVYLAEEFFVSGTNVDVGLAKLLAFEHAVTTVAADDEGYADLLSAQGFPRSKFVTEESFLDSL
ncbi:MAG: glycosyltransferase family A protein [Kordiimonas sp.]